MKRLLLTTIAALTFAGAAHAAPIASTTGTPPVCSFIAGMSQAIAEDRDQGVSLQDELRSIASTNAPDKIKRVATKMAVAIYNDPEVRSASPKAIASALLLACVEKFKRSRL